MHREKRKRSLSVGKPAGKVSKPPPARRNNWEVREQDEERLRAHREAASNLTEHLLQLYAYAKIDAKAFCIACYWAKESGVRKDELQKYAFAPGKASGHYMRHLRTVLPTTETAP